MCSSITGRSAGTAAALSLQDNVTPRKLDVSKLQKVLAEDRK
ncbi:MAG: FAD-dependent oxidoreductase [Victivallales bacterium]|nr:FAD-dependent oxidoreductase [Victivallales bacterium]